MKLQTYKLIPTLTELICDCGGKMKKNGTSMGTNPFIALPLSLTCAYLSNWIGLLFMWLNNKYNKIWERLNKQK